MNLISIDPHIIKPYAYSIWVNGELENYGYFKAIFEFNMLVIKSGVDLVLIEDQFLGKNFSTAKALTLNTGKIVGICELHDIKHEIINVATWKSKLPELQRFDKDKTLTKYRRKKAKVQAMIDKATEIINREGMKGHLIDEDIASAVLIAWIMKIKGD